jgi:colanic acid/amylovoran biosynthesis glycosyltransferase
MAAGRRPVKVAYLISRYPLLSHTFILREVRGLRRAGAEVDTFTIRRSEPDEILSDVDRQEDASTHAILPPSPGRLVAAHLRGLLTGRGRYAKTLRLALALRGRGTRAALWQLFYFAEAALMWDECRRRRLRHIHAHHANVASDVALLAASLGGSGWSWSFTMHGSAEFFDVRENRLAQKVELALFVVCISDHGRSQLMSLVGPEHWDKLRVVHCGVDVSAFAPVPERDGGGPVEVLTVGRALPVKGHALLIEAVAALAERGDGVRLTLVGDGPLLGHLQDLAASLGVADRVEFAGAVGQDSVRDFYARADVFALSSFAEGLPVVLIEAHAMGLPVVAPAITGIPELVEHGESGLLVVPGRADALADALARVASVGPEGRRAMGRAGRARVESEFDIERTARELLAVFGEFLPADY